MASLHKRLGPHVDVKDLVELGVAITMQYDIEEC